MDRGDGDLLAARCAALHDGDLRCLLMNLEYELSDRGLITEDDLER